ncbi:MULTISPECIES: TIGR03084 family metal-binding protein [unclassified Micromonospora]|uniref:TIGR03084 family metal-binding protein n=1 Tax=unclassified Micromonospora TaxID=2617518 RepID=UPI0036384EA8
MTAQDVIADVVADAEDIDRMIAGLDESQWRLPTPAEGWTVAHQVGHLAFVFRIAGLAAGNPEAFKGLTQRIGAGFGAFDKAVNAALDEYLALSREALVVRWRAERDAGVAALAAVPDGTLVPWLVRPIPAPVLCAAGMTEMFAHGQDIADALGVEREHTDRIRQIVGFVVHTRDFGYESNDLTPPAEQFRFDITAPSGEQWVFGPADATQTITGPAVDLCLLAGRRRHHADLGLVATGPDAQAWLELAQAYRGPAGKGRAPGQFVTSRQPV